MSCPCDGPINKICQCGEFDVNEFVVANYYSPKTRKEYIGDREYLVAPVSMLVPGVLNGSKGPLLYPKTEVIKDYQAWNFMPLTLGHPTDERGNATSARHPDIIKKFCLGFVFNTNIDKGKLDGEAWFDVENTRKLSPQILERLNSNATIELSTGLFTDNRPVKNGSYNGKKYVAIAMNYKPDHLAILPDKKGACSREDGCGVLINSEKHIKEEEGSKENWVWNEWVFDCPVWPEGMVLNKQSVPPNVKLDKPFRTPGQKRKFAVYTNGPKGTPVIVRFGDPNMEIKRDSPERINAYRSRMGCDTPRVGPKWKANYWSCQMWRKDKTVGEMLSNIIRVNPEGKYELVSKKAKRILGVYGTEEEALKREEQIKRFVKKEKEPTDNLYFFDVIVVNHNRKGDHIGWGARRNLRKSLRKEKLESVAEISVGSKVKLPKGTKLIKKNQHLVGKNLIVLGKVNGGKGLKVADIKDPKKTFVVKATKFAKGKGTKKKVTKKGGGDSGKVKFGVTLKGVKNKEGTDIRTGDILSVGSKVKGGNKKYIGEEVTVIGKNKRGGLIAETKGGKLINIRSNMLSSGKTTAKGEGGETTKKKKKAVPKGKKLTASEKEQRVRDSLSQSSKQSEQMRIASLKVHQKKGGAEEQIKENIESHQLQMIKDDKKMGGNLGLLLEKHPLQVVDPNTNFGDKVVGRAYGTYHPGGYSKGKGTLYGSQYAKTYNVTAEELVKQSNKTGTWGNIALSGKTGKFSIGKDSFLGQRDRGATEENGGVWSTSTKKGLDEYEKQVGAKVGSKKHLAISRAKHEQALDRAAAAKVKVTQTHEMGHHIHYQMSNYPSLGTNKLIYDAYLADRKSLKVSKSDNQHLSGKGKGKMTRYAFTNAKEYWSESYAAYHHMPETLSPRAKSMVESVIGKMGEISVAPQSSGGSNIKTSKPASYW